MTDSVTAQEAFQILSEYPYFAMILDEHHQVIAANTYFMRHANWDPSQCPVSCFSVMHSNGAPHNECPLVESVASGARVVRDLVDPDLGDLRVEVFPIDIVGPKGDRLYMHLAAPRGE